MGILDRKDLLILELLQADGARSNKDLARRVGLSASACLERVRRLEREGVIERYAAIIGPAAFPDAVEGWAQIVLAQRTHALTAAVAVHLGSSDIVIETYELTGPVDLLVRFVAPSVEEWLLLSRSLENAFPEVASIRHGLVSARPLRRALALDRLSGIDRQDPRSSPTIGN